MAFVTKKHIDQLHAGLIERGLLGKFVWRGLTRASVINRFCDETMKKMVETGCYKIAIGVESGNDDVLVKIQKKVTTDEIANAVSKLTQFEIQAKGFFVLGFPGETEAQMLDTISFISHLKDLGMTEISAFQFKPYPGTKAYAEIIEYSPEIISELDYLRHTDLAEGKAEARASDTPWLPSELRIAAVKSSRVQELVVLGLKTFYG
jgi:radical SAM superfamily enzyme YgiQ (UPF0313 family)